MSSSSSSSPAAEADILLSLLPEVLDDILTRLPLEEVVRTCCLSRAWARRWESVSGLALRFRGEYSAAAVSAVLARCAAPVARFDVAVRGCLRPRAAYWLRALADKRVRSLNLDFESSRGDVRHGVGLVFPAAGRAIYDCGELSDLRLRYCELPRPPVAPSFAGFPRLTRLVLSSVALPFAGGGTLLERVIAGAPDLADLVLGDVLAGGGEADAEVEAWAIRARKLSKLTLWMAVDNGGRIAERLPLLETANVIVDCFLGSEDLLHTLWKVAAVKVLNFSVYDREFNENPLEGITWKFQNLRISTLTVDFGKMSSIISIFSLLRCAPQIEQLHIEVDRREKLNDDIDEETIDEEMSDGLVKTLKRVTITLIKCFPSEMCFIELLLSKATSLESLKVMLFWERLMSFEEACTCFASYKKASPQVKFAVMCGMEAMNIPS